MKETDILDHFHFFCAQGTWFHKILRKQCYRLEITRHDVMGDILAERNRILAFSGVHDKKELRKSLNAIAAKYIYKISCWAKKERGFEDKA